MKHSALIRIGLLWELISFVKTKHSASMIGLLWELVPFVKTHKVYNYSERRPIPIKLNVSFLEKIQGVTFIKKINVKI